jgi:hypothetical protein
MNPKKDKSISCTISIHESVWNTVKALKKNIKKTYGIYINTNPLIESFLVENILPWLDYIEKNHFVPYEQFVKLKIKQEVIN